MYIWFPVDSQSNAVFHESIHSNSQQNNHKVRAYYSYLTEWFLKNYFVAEGKFGFLEILRFVSFSCNCTLQQSCKCYLTER